MNKTIINDQIVKRHVKKFNSAVNRARKAKINLFRLFLNSYKTLTTEEFVLFKSEIDYEKSTINKLEKICKKSIIVNSLSKLPESWGTLIELTRMSDQNIQQLLDSDSITKRTTKEEVKALLKNNKAHSNVKLKLVKPHQTPSRAEYIIVFKKELSQITQIQKTELMNAIVKISEFIIFPEEITNQLTEMKEVA